MATTVSNFVHSADTFSGSATSFGYDALENKGRRKPPAQKLRSEDDEITQGQRGQLITLGRDMRRNFSIAAWAIRKHLDYVANLKFQSKTGITEFDKLVEELMGWWGRSKNFDVAKRHGLSRHLKLIESHRTIEGDVFTLKLKSGQVQAIEGDRVRTPSAWPSKINSPPDWIDRVRHGVLLGKSGESLGYVINRRGRNGSKLRWPTAANSFEFERLVPARDVVHVGYFDRFDQVRGSSRMNSGMNSLRDVYEGLDYALAKAKVSQMVALKMTGFDTDEAPEEIDWGRGPVSLKLGDGEDVELLSSNTPSSEWQAFINYSIAAALKAFDIPFCFYDESIGNYSANRGSWLQYDVSAEGKREDLREYLDNLTTWRLGMFVYYGTLKLPAGFDLARDMRWTWIANRVPWIDPLKEVQAFRQAVSGGFDSTVGVAGRTGRDAYELAEEEAAYQKYRESIGLERTDIPLAPVPITINEGNN